MNDPDHPESPAPEPNPRPGLPGADRREVLRGIAGLGAAFGSLPLLGNSLLLRSVAPLPAEGCPTTLTKSLTKAWTQTASVPATFTATGTSDDPDTGTYTITLTGGAPETLTYTAVWPAPDGGTQPVTIAETISFSFSPPATNTITYSWKGHSFTQTISHQPNSWSVSLTDIKTVSYTSTTPCDEDPVDPIAPNPVDVPRSEDEVVVDSVDAAMMDLFDPRMRSDHARILRLAACGVGR